MRSTQKSSKNQSENYLPAPINLPLRKLPSGGSIRTNDACLTVKVASLTIVLNFNFQASFAASYCISVAKKKDQKLRNLKDCNGGI